MDFMWPQGKGGQATNEAFGWCGLGWPRELAAGAPVSLGLSGLDRSFSPQCFIPLLRGLNNDNNPELPLPHKVLGEGAVSVWHVVSTINCLSLLSHKMALCGNFKPS